MSLRFLTYALRLFAVLDLLALGAVAMPHRWMAAIHESIGLGAIPEAPVVDYLARSSSAMYALYGAVLFFVSLDVVRYWRLIRFLGCAAVIHGLVIVFIDIAAEMPLLWTMIEGPCFTLSGVVILAAQMWTNDDALPVKDES